MMEMGCSLLLKSAAFLERTSEMQGHYYNKFNPFYVLFSQILLSKLSVVTFL